MNFWWSVFSILHITLLDKSNCAQVQVSSRDQRLCVVPKLENGRTRAQGKLARNVRFNCRKDFQLMGDKYAHCVRGSWDVNIPTCIKPGCKWTRREHMNGLFLESYRGAFVKVVCNPGYSTLGPTTVYCNGQRWNGTFPYCQPQTKEPAEACDFNGPDLCGWTHDPENKGIDWKISDARSGKPSYDHTSLLSTQLYPTTNAKGSYMAFGNSAEEDKLTYEEQSARLYSPVYPAYYYVNKDMCFSVWYFLSGSTAGTLKIYYLMEGDTVSSSMPEVWIQGDQGNKWRQAMFPVSGMDRDFQILIEGSDGVVAIDDVKIGFDQECTLPEENDVTPGLTPDWTTTTDAFDTVNDFTCKGRCKLNAVLIGTNITADELEETAKCDCFPGCQSNHTCCNDFTVYCTTTVDALSTVQQLHVDEESTDFSSLITSTVVGKLINTPTMSYQRNFTEPSEQKTTSEPTITTSAQVKEVPATTKQTTTRSSTSKPNSTVKTVRPIKLTTTSKLLPSSAGKARLTTTVKPTIAKDLPPAANTQKPVIKSTERSRVPSKKPKSVSNDIPVLNPARPKVNDQYYNRRTAANTLPIGETMQEAVKAKEPDVAHVRIPVTLVAEVASSVAIALLLLTAVVIFIRRRIRLSNNLNLVEDSDSILFGMGSSANNLYSSSSSLIGIRGRNGRMTTL